jgi:threonine synthase
VATAFAEGGPVAPVRPATAALSIAIGNPADGNLALETAHESGGAIYAVPEDEIASNIGELARSTGVFGETAPAVTFGALKQAVSEGSVGGDDRVVLLVSGDGLKTPGLVRHRRAAHDQGRRRPVHRGRARTAADRDGSGDRLTGVA